MNIVKPLFIIIAMVAYHVSAETVTHSVDNQGNVTYSDKPVSNTVQEERISIDAPAPSVEVQQRETNLQNAASQAGTSSAPGNTNQKKASRQDTEYAEKHLV